MVQRNPARPGAYPHPHDDEFIEEHRDEWLGG
jgi:hypothetical protein